MPTPAETASRRPDDPTARTAGGRRWASTLVELLREPVATALALSPPPGTVLLAGGVASSAMRCEIGEPGDATVTVADGGSDTLAEAAPHEVVVTCVEGRRSDDRLAALATAAASCARMLAAFVCDREERAALTEHALAAGFVRVELAHPRPDSPRRWVLFEDSLLLAWHGGPDS